MPRISTPYHQTKYKMNDFVKWLRGRMAYEDISQAQLAEKLGTTQPNICRKMKKCDFSLKDLIIIFDYLKTGKEEIGNLLR